MKKNEQELRGELAGLIRECRDLIAERLERCYVEQYPHSRSNQMNASDIHEWTLAEIEATATAVERDEVEGRLFQEMYGDQLVDPHNPELTPFVNWLSTLHFEARTIAPVLFAARLSDPAHGNALVNLYESHIQKVIAANCQLYSQQVSEPRALVRTWDLMSGLCPRSDIEDTPARRYRLDETLQDTPSAPPGIKQPPFGSLSPREKQVLDLLVTGMTNGEIAATLDIRQNTVKNHVAHIFDKYNVNTRAELVSYVLSR